MSGTTFPPLAPTSVKGIIPSYLYQQYNDDDDLQAFVDVYNAMAQQYLDWFNTVELPVYTQATIFAGLLDWVAQGLYGYARPVLPAGTTQDIGAYDTFGFNELEFNGFRRIGPTVVYVTDDDIYKRCITWHFYKGDGKVFNVRWLKRRIMRFLIGVNGTSPNIDQTYQISVTFGTDAQVNIRILDSIRLDTGGGAIFNASALNDFGFNEWDTTVQQFTPIADALILQAGIESGALELPFQFIWIVTIENALPIYALWDDGGVLAFVGPTFYPTSPAGLLPGALWCNGGFGGVVSVVPGNTPDPFAPPVFFGTVSAASLFVLTGTNLPFTPPTPGSNQLWNNGGLVCIA